MESLLLLASVGPSSLEETAHALGASPGNVLGALVGVDGRYRAEDSLVALGLVADRSVRGRIFYEVTAGGVRVASRLRRERRRAWPVASLLRVP